MIVGVVFLILFIITFIIGYAVFNEPITILTDTLSDAYPGGFASHDDNRDMMSFISLILPAAIITGIIMAMVWYAIWGQKDEYEK
jgi:hypothetical protein